ncbi:tautomerase family protein [Rhodoferax sp. TH121]|uniref:tautomerase family protein n=1 Tax=Rhodoferax sp. TH121 TaxID=2022803 RepID=UPI000B97A1A7|nr:tautomerase family protein [Rhodoferax sp. TH121]OYQ39240.1 tautomerase family protein [Rhodoferax sp. TH121]
MPLARIDLCAGKPDAYRRRLADIVYESMLDTLNAPRDDQFQVIAQHAPGDVIANPTYLGIQRSSDVVFIQLFLLAGRSVAQKKAFYETVAETLHCELGVRREDVFIGLVEVTRENWSFGNGLAQYVTE